MNEKNAAFILFKEGVSQQDIAVILQRSEQTITRWKKEGNWEQKAAEDLLNMETIHEDTRELVQYQLHTLKRLKDTYLEAEQNGSDPKLIGKGDIDGLRDLYNIIKHKETDWTTIVRIVRLINKYMKDNYPELARQVAPVLNEFLNEQRGGTQ